MFFFVPFHSTPPPTLLALQSPRCLHLRSQWLPIQPFLPQTLILLSANQKVPLAPLPFTLVTCQSGTGSPLIWLFLLQLWSRRAFYQDILRIEQLVSSWHSRMLTFYYVREHTVTGSQAGLQLNSLSCQKDLTINICCHLFPKITPPITTLICTSSMGRLTPMPAP